MFYFLVMALEFLAGWVGYLIGVRFEWRLGSRSSTGRYLVFVDFGGSLCLGLCRHGVGWYARLDARRAQNARPILTSGFREHMVKKLTFYLDRRFV